MNVRKGILIYWKILNGDLEAEYLLADALYYGSHGLEENEDRALELMSNAAGRGHPDALFSMSEWVRQFQMLGHGGVSSVSKRIYKVTPSCGIFFAVR